MRNLEVDRDCILNELKELLRRYDYELPEHRIESVFLGVALRYADDDHTYLIELAELINVLRMPGSIDVIASKSPITIHSDYLKSALLKQLDFLWGLYFRDVKELTIEPEESLNMIRKASKNDDRFYKRKLPARRLGFQLSYVYHLLKERKVFGEKPTRKERCLLYDYLTILGEVERLSLYTFRGDVAKEKSDMVKNWMNAYESMQLK